MFLLIYKCNQIFLSIFIFFKFLSLCSSKCIDSSNLLSILLSPTQNQKEPSLDRLDFDVDEIKSLYQILLTQRVNEGCDFCAAAKNASRNTISKLES